MIKIIHTSLTIQIFITLQPYQLVQLIYETLGLNASSVWPVIASNAENMLELTPSPGANLQARLRAIHAKMQAEGFC